MIGTWSGPGWAPCNTITSLLMAIQGLVMIDHPLVNEPGHETDPEGTLNLYNYIIEHETIRYALLEMLKKPPQALKYSRIQWSSTFMIMLNGIVN